MDLGAGGFISFSLVEGGFAMVLSVLILLLGGGVVPEALDSGDAMLAWAGQVWYSLLGKVVGWKSRLEDNTKIEGLFPFYDQKKACFEKVMVSLSRQIMTTCLRN